MEGSSFNPRTQIGTGEGESPLAPRPAVPPASPLEARTFSSDLGSIRNTGGAEPAPYTPPPASEPASPAAPKSVQSPSTPFGQSGNVSPGIAIGGTFPKAGGAPPSFVPPPRPSPASLSPIIPPGAPRRGGKKIFVAIFSFLIVVALGAVGYFFIYPLFVENAPEAPAPAPAPALPTPEPSETPQIPSTPENETNIQEGAGGSEPEIPAADPFAGIRGIAAHRSLFRTAPNAATEVILTEPTLPALKSALPSGSVASPLISEVVLKMPSGTVIPFSALAPLFSPTFFTAERLASFDDDATYFTYAAANGTWLGIAVPLKAGAPLGPVQDGMSALQGDPNLTKFFLENPGERGIWADGSVRGKPTSQVSFEAPGAAFSYTWLDRNLLLSTNLTGAEAAAERLGF